MSLDQMKQLCKDLIEMEGHLAKDQIINANVDGEDIGNTGDTIPSYYNSGKMSTDLFSIDSMSEDIIENSEKSYERELSHKIELKTSDSKPEAETILFPLSMHDTIDNVSSLDSSDLDTKSSVE